jgi:putative ABC transport system permease protein
VRWAVRLFRREWRQQLLVLAMLTLAVAAAVGGSVAVINGASDAIGRFGTGGAIVRVDAGDTATAQRTIDAVRAQFGVIDVVAHATVAVPGSVVRLDVRDQDPTGAYGHPMLGVRDGRLPAGASEAAFTEGAARSWGASLGDTVELDGRSMTVVGIVENPAQLDDDFVLVAPGTLPEPASYTVLVDPDTRTTSGGQGQGAPPFGLEIEGSDKQAVAVGMLAVSTLAMALVALIASAGFVVVAQRRQRQLGLLAAIGATPRHVRLVTVANGMLVGVVAAAVGGALGVAGWIVAAPAVESAANRRIGRFDLPWTVVLSILLIAVVMATLAAWWPARATSRLPVMAALSGRPARPHPVHRSLLAAVALIAGGVAAVAAADPGGERVQPLLLIGGLLAVVLGAVFAAPAAIRSVAALARRLPFAPRLALRDLARYQSRAAAALAAIAFGVGIAVSIVAVAQANTDSAAEGNLSDRELLIRVGDVRNVVDPESTTDEATAALDAGAAAVAAAVGDDVTPIALDVVFSPRTAESGNVREPVGVVRPVNEHMMELLGYVYVATPEVLDLYGIDPAVVDPATDLLTSRRAPVTLADMSRRPDRQAAAPVVQHMDLPAYDQAPNSLVTEGAVERHGWVRQRAAWIIESSSPLTAAQIDAARRAAAEAGLAIETRDAQDSLAALRTIGTLAGVMLAIAIVAMALGLIRGESAGDVRTLTATGAAARTRRALTASTAAALGLLGAVLGVGLAYLVLLAAYRSDLGELTPVPARELVVFGAGLPVAATAVGWLLAGREPSSFSGRSLD